MPPKSKPTKRPQDSYSLRSMDDHESASGFDAPSDSSEDTITVRSEPIARPSGSSEEAIAGPSSSPTAESVPGMPEVSITSVMNMMAQLLHRSQQERSEDKERMARLEQKRDSEKLIDKIPPMFESSDVELYLQSLENELIQANIPRGRWKSLLTPRLTPTLKEQIGDLQGNLESTYEDIKARLLDRAGLTPLQAGQQLFNMRPRDVKDMSSSQLIQKVDRLLYRTMRGADTLQDAVDKLCFARIRSLMSVEGQQQVDSWRISSKDDLRAALLSWETTRGSIARDEQPRWSQQQGYTTGRIICFKCQKPGHRAVDCRSSFTATNQQPGGNYQPRCFACGVVGHKSPDCPSRHSPTSKPMEDSDKNNNVQKETFKQAEVNVVNRETTNTLTAILYDQTLPLLLDTGAQMSVIPEEMVPASAKTGRKVQLKGYNGKIDEAEVACVSLCVGKRVWKGEVALVKGSDLDGKGILAINLKDNMAWEIMSEYREDVKAVNAVETRQQRIVNEREEREDNECVEREQAGSTVVNLHEGSRGEECVASEEVEIDSEDELNLADVEGEEDIPSEVGDEVDELKLTCVKEGGDRDVLIKEVNEDVTLKSLRELADRGERGYYWEDGVLVQRCPDFTYGTVVNIVVPKSRRSKIMQLAHDKLGHLGHKKVASTIKRNFVWPLMNCDIRKHCESCLLCQKVNKAGQRKALMIERPVLSQPFEQIALDLVGPLPKGRGGARFVLTAACMATRWPEAVALKSVTAKSVAEAAIEIFSRMGLPYQVLTYRGPQFIGSLAKHVTSMLGIERLHTTAYHPQTNGVLERLHATLEAMLAKAHAEGMDWVRQLPFVLFALRQAPNRTTGFSPYELVYGQHVRTPLDVVYEGWRNKECEGLAVGTWVEELCDRLEILRDVATKNGLVESEKRKNTYDKGKCERVLCEGDKVLCRIPGLNGKLEDSWEGPFIVLKKLSAVNYRIEEVDGRKKKKVVHVNNVKKFKERELEICALTVLAEDHGLDDSNVLLRDEVCEGFNEEELMGVLSKFSSVMSDLPGETSVAKMTIEVDEGTHIISQRPYRVPDRLKDGVKQEVDLLLESGIIEPSVSAWASPLVPVVKPDGKVRLCVDYRKLNSVTPQLQQYIPTLDDVLERAGSAKVLSKMDLAKGFYQVQMAGESCDLTTFVSPWGKYRFKRMPFGLKNAPAMFQSLMETVLKECLVFASVYIDDVLIYSSSWSEHLQHIEQVLVALKEAGLTAKPGKCQWGRCHLDYLGHRVGGGKVAVPWHRVQVMAEFRQPVTKRDLRAFLGSVGYYRRFIPNFAAHSALLTPATSGMAPVTVRWNQEMLGAFDHLRKSLCSHCVLTVPCVSDVFQLHTDASGVGVGCVLNVIRDGVEYPVAFYSRQLRGAEKRYSATELEALAVVASIQHFAHFLFGASFTVLTDHNPLTSLLSSKSLNRRLHGMALKIMQFDVTILYREGTQNGNADGLSRQSWSDKTDDEKSTPVDVMEDDKEEICATDCAAFLPDAGLCRGGCGNTHRENISRRAKDEH